MKISRCDHLGNIQFSKRLQRLYYKKVSGKPSRAVTFSENGNNILLFITKKDIEKSLIDNGPVNINVRDGRIVSMTSNAGQQLASISLEPEDIGRITGPKMKYRQLVTLQGISPYLQNVLIALGNAHFYSHSGIDVPAIGRALLVNINETRFAKGASTITQQLAKNFFLSQ